MFSSIPCLFPLDAKSTSSTNPNNKYVCRHCQISCGGQKCLHWESTLCELNFHSTRRLCTGVVCFALRLNFTEDYFGFTGSIAAEAQFFLHSFYKTDFLGPIVIAKKGILDNCLWTWATNPHTNQPPSFCSLTTLPSTSYSHYGLPSDPGQCHVHLLLQNVTCLVLVPPPSWRS